MRRASANTNPRHRSQIVRELPSTKAALPSADIVRNTAPWSAVLYPTPNATFIDQDYCFNGGEWTFPASPLRGAYATNCVYERVMGWEAFEPALSRAEQMDAHAILAVCSGSPGRMVRGRPDWSGASGGDALASTAYDLKVDRRMSQVEPEPVSELA